MNKAKKAFILILAICVMLSLSACGAGGNNTGTDTSVDDKTAAAPDTAQQEAAFDPMAKYEPGITLTLAGSEGDPNVKYPEGISPAKNPWRDAYREELGITFENKWTVPDSKYAEKLNTQIAAGDVPDILNGLGRAQFDQLIKLGLATPMNELIDKYATETTKKVLNSDGGYSLLYCTGEDGKLYGLPYVYGFADNAFIMWVRTDWLEKSNLQAPSTLAELRDVLKAFVKDDPDDNGKDDTLGLLTTSSLWDVDPIFNAYGAQPFWSWYKDSDGRLKYSTVYKTNEMKQALEYLQSLYKEGLMDQEFGTVSWDKYNEICISGKAGIAFMPRWYASVTLGSCIANNPSADWEAYPIPGLSADTPAKPFAYYGPAAYNVISTKCKNPEAAVKVLNLFCEKIYGADASANSEKFSMTKDGFDMKTLAVLNSEWANRFDMYENVAGAVAANDPSGLNTEEKIHYDGCIAYKNGNMDKWGEYKTYGPNNPTVGVIKYYLEKAMPLFSNYYGPSTESVKQYQGDLDAKWTSICVQIVMGQKPVSAYDDFVAEWYKLGGDKMEKEINEYGEAHPDIVK